MSLEGEGKVRILVVEDSKTQAAQLQFILESEGYEVDVVYDGDQAIERLGRESYDLVLMDVIMPRMSGLEACHTLKKDAATMATPIVLVTHLDSPGDMLKGLQAGADNYVTKPYQQDQILRRVRWLIERPGVDLPGDRGVELEFEGESYTITSDKMQILRFVLPLLAEPRHEEAADLERLRAETILDSTADGIITIDESGIVRSYNRAAQKIFGYAAKEVVGNNVSILMPSPYREEPEGYLEWCRPTGEANILGSERELEGRRKDGTTFPLLLRVKEFDQVEGWRYIAMLRDITEHQIAEATLKRQQAEYRGLVEEAMYGNLPGDHRR